jgi:hypothetical protein
MTKPAAIADTDGIKKCPWRLKHDRLTEKLIADGIAPDLAEHNIGECSWTGMTLEEIEDAFDYSNGGCVTHRGLLWEMAGMKPPF